MKSKIKNYFQRAANYSTWRFILELSAVSFILKISFVIVGLPILSLLGFSTANDLSLEESFLDYYLWQAVGLVIIYASIETITSQMFVLWLTKHISKDTAFRIFVSALIFALLHVEPMLIVAVFPIGLILAWTYLLYRQKSVWSALWVTTAIHVIHNLFALWLVYLS